jgi:hypothetical protein
MTVYPDAIARDNPDIVEAVKQNLLGVNGDGCNSQIDGTDGTDDKNTAASGGEKKEKRESQADLLLKIVEDSGAEFFHTPTDEQFISFTLGQHDETWPIRSRAARRWVTTKFYRQTGKAPNNEAMQSALSVLEARAACEGDEREVYLRAAWHEGSLYYDLADSEWRAVRIDGHDWEIVTKPPVRFRRYSNTLPQVEPVTGGTLDAIWNFLNVKKEADRRLVESWLVSALNPDIPRPMLVTHGDQGTAKSSTSKILLSLVDPSATPCLRTRDATELVQALAHRFAAVLDNVSSLPAWLSDLLCCAITGDGFTKRQLFTDDDDVIYSYRRALLFNGINVAVSKPDLLDRSLLIQLDQIGDDVRREEQDLWRDFYQARPAILGAIFTRLSGAIGRYDTIKSGRLPRMADFARWAMAATGDVQQFLADYKINVGRQNYEAIAESIVATVILDWLKDQSEWSGQPHELHAALKAHLQVMQINEKQFPATPAWLSKKLREIRPNLNQLGWKIHFASGGDRLITISRELGKSTAVTAAAADIQQNQPFILGGNTDNSGGTGSSTKPGDLKLNTRNQSNSSIKGGTGSKITLLSSPETNRLPGETLQQYSDRLDQIWKDRK